VTFGIVPTAPETGYGYIKSESGKASGIGQVDEFVEKPDLSTAEAYLSSGDYFWNSGMFLFKASRYLEELERFNPEMLHACRESYAKSTSDLDFMRIDKASFEQCPDDSIDYAVMEKTDNAYVVSLDASWSDVGSWSALWEVSQKDEDGNTCKGDVITKDTENCYIQSDKGCSGG